MPRSFDDLVRQAKQVFSSQEIYVDRVCGEHEPMDTYRAANAVVETMDDQEIVQAISEAAQRREPLPSRTGSFNQADLMSLLSDALVACLQAKLSKDSAIRAKEQKRMKNQ